MRIKNDNNLKVVTVRILAFLSGCILASLKAVYTPLKKILVVNIRNLLLGMSGCILALLKAVCKIASLQSSGHLIWKVYLLCQHNS